MESIGCYSIRIVSYVEVIVKMNCLSSPGRFSFMPKAVACKTLTVK
jgi:hypothetical protein